MGAIASKFLSRFRSKRIAGVVDDYMENRRDYYTGPDGVQTKSVLMIEVIMKRLVGEFGDLPIKKFSPQTMKQFQRHCIEDDLARSTINAYRQQVLAFLEWCASEQVIPVEIYQAVRTVKALRKNRGGAREAKPVGPVAPADVFRLHRFIRPVFYKLARLHMHTGARPGELINLRPMDIDQRGDVWIVKPEAHKTAYLGKERLIAFGPRCQAILRELMEDLPAFSYIFSPNGGRTPYSVGSWRRATYRACDNA